MLQGLTDSLYNLVANLGTDRDKAAATRYGMPSVDVGQLSAMYRGSAIAKKIVDIPAEDMCREWRAWQGTSEQISALEAEEKRLGVVEKCLFAHKKARLEGGAAIYISTGDQRLDMPLSPERVRQGGIEYLTVIGRNRLSAKDIERDPRSPNFNKPKAYTISGVGAGTLLIDPSRLIIFPGEELLEDHVSGADLAWGESVLVSCMENIRSLDATMANVASLVFEAKVDVIGIPGLMANLQSGGEAYERLVLRRATLAQTGKGINGTLITDAEEQHSQKTASFANLPAIIDRFMQMTSAASSIPMTLLFGMSPGGLNATGEGDARGYYDRIRAKQSLILEPALQVFDECLIRSALGDRPEEVFYNWNSLWQPTAKERAETGKIIADTYQVLFNLDAAPEEVLQSSIINGLTESGFAPGLEGSVEEFTSEDPEQVTED